MIKPEDLAKILAVEADRQTYMINRGYIMNEMLAAIDRLLIGTDRVKFYRTMYKERDYQEFTGETGWVYIRGSEKRFVSNVPKIAKSLCGTWVSVLLIKQRLLSNH
jgi:hypothetical protein